MGTVERVDAAEPWPTARSSSAGRSGTTDRTQELGPRHFSCKLDCPESQIPHLSFSGGYDAKQKEIQYS